MARTTQNRWKTWRIQKQNINPNRILSFFFRRQRDKLHGEWCMRNRHKKGKRREEKRKTILLDPVIENKERDRGIGIKQGYHGREAKCTNHADRGKKWLDRWMNESSLPPQIAVSMTPIGILPNNAVAFRKVNSPPITQPAGHPLSIDSRFGHIPVTYYGS